MQHSRKSSRNVMDKYDRKAKIEDAPQPQLQRRRAKRVEKNVSKNTARQQDLNLQFQMLQPLEQKLDLIDKKIEITKGLYNAIHRAFDKLLKFSPEKGIDDELSKRMREKMSPVYDLIEQRLSAASFSANHYKQTIDQLAELAKTKIKVIWEELSQQDKNQYQKIKERIKSRYEKNPMLVKFYHSELTTEDLFRLDVLGYFFIRDREYLSYCSKDITILPIITKRTLQVIFGPLKYYKEMQERAEYYCEWISLCHQFQLSELVTIISVIQVKYRFCNDKLRYGNLQTKKALEISQFRFEQRFSKKDGQRSWQKEEIFKYKYCQLVFSFLGHPFESRAPKIKEQIIIKLSEITKFLSFQARKQQILETKYQYNIVFSNIIQQYNKVKSEKQMNFNGISLQDIPNMSWLYIDELKAPINLRRKYLYQHRKLLPEHTVQKAFFLQGIYKYQLLTTMLNQSLFSGIVDKRQKVFIQKLKFSYNQLIKKKYPDNKTKLLKKDLQPTLILGLNKQGPFFISYHKRPINDEEQRILINNIFNENKQSQFTFVLFQLCQKKDWKALRSLYWNCKIQMDSNAYASFDAKPFYVHMLFTTLVNKYLLKIDFSKNTFENIVESVVYLVMKSLSQQQYPSEQNILEKVITNQQN